MGEKKSAKKKSNSKLKPKTEVIQDKKETLNLDSYEDGYFDDNAFAGANTNADKFLELYRRLEYVGKTQFFPNAPENENVVARLINQPIMKKYKEELNYCRVVRNFLTHNPRISGEYFVEPSSTMIALLEEVLTVIENPAKAIDFAVKRQDMLVFHKQDYLVDALKQMKLRAYTHVPVMKNNTLVGIFGDNIMTQYIIDVGSLTIDSETRLALFSDYLTEDLRTRDSVRFIDIETTVEEVNQIFLDNYHSGHIVSAIFITQTGRKDEQIIAMITPWDIISTE